MLMHYAQRISRKCIYFCYLILMSALSIACIFQVHYASTLISINHSYTSFLNGNTVINILLITKSALFSLSTLNCLPI